MFRINAVKLEVQTTSGLFGREFHFEKGLNIIRGNNTSGKSTLAQAILYSMGLEELLGGRNEATMQSVLKDQVEYPEGKTHRVIQSFAYLEIENGEGEIITTKRSIISANNRDSKLIDVYQGKLLSKSEEEYLDSQPMFIHDKGGASNKVFGFHYYLANFIGWDLPEVTTSQGYLSPLYIQQIASSFIVEQKAGWGDFLASMPYYNIKNAGARVIEFILNLDVFQNEKKKQDIFLKKTELNNLWRENFDKLSGVSKACRGELKGVLDKPRILSPSDSIDIVFFRDNGVNINLKDFLSELDSQLSNIRDSILSNQDNNDEFEVQRIQQLIRDKEKDYETINTLKQRVRIELNSNQEQKTVHLKHLKTTQLDLDNNKGALKVELLGAEMDFSVVHNNCPTCHQEISGSLLPETIKNRPMSIEDNIGYLIAQEQMLRASLATLKRSIDDKTDELARFEFSQEAIIDGIRALKRDLMDNANSPSRYEIQEQIRIEDRINLYSRAYNELQIIRKDFHTLSNNYREIITEEKSIPQDTYTKEDINKLNFFTREFKRLLKDLGYKSKSVSSIRISPDKYLPVVGGLTDDLVYNIKFDSSGTDFIRCMWAYYLSLMSVSINKNGNHPCYIMFDEPKQQDLSVEDFKTFLATLSQFADEQIFVFASFQNDDGTFESSTEGLDFHLLRIEDRLIKPLA